MCLDRLGWVGLGFLGWLDWIGWVRLGGLVSLFGWVGIDWDRLGNVSLGRWGWVRLGELVGLDGLVGLG